MNNNEFEILRRRYQAAKSLRERIKKCKSEVSNYTHLEGVAIPLSKQQEYAKKKLDYWLTELDKAKQKYLDF